MNAPLALPPVRTTCPYCGVGCGVIAKPDGFGGASIEGDREHPANFGRLCSKGSALGETLSLEDRCLYPMMRTGGAGLERTSWDTGLTRVAETFKATIERYGPDSVAFYVSGQLLTEDYYVANKLMKGFIGSGNIDTNSRLCMASSVAGHRRAFGSDTVPGSYEDLDEADLFVLVGSNAAWCHPILFQRMMKAKRERGARIVVIDPRLTPTGLDADLALQIAPGTDQILFAGLLVHLVSKSAFDHKFIKSHTSGFEDALDKAMILAPSLENVASACDAAREAIRTFYDWVTATTKTVTLYSQGVNQSSRGTDKVNAIINCHLATGRIGRPGMGPFSLTGQPNAMGGREVGGLANQLAAHMDFDTASRDRLARFWKSNSIAERPGFKAVDLFEAVAQRRVKALWVMGTNPAVSMPRADAVRAALRELELLVVSDVVEATDTLAAEAHVLFPAAAWGEKDGTVTNSERRISRQRAFLTAPGDAKPDWWIMSEVARRMGFADAFPYTCAADIFREHAALSAFENEGTRDFDLSGLAGLSDDAYGALAPVQWPVKQDAGTERLFGDGQFFTADRRARFVAVEETGLAVTREAAFPLLLNTGRIRDHWHTMTRTGKSPRLGQHIDEPFVAVSPQDAAERGLVEASFARITTLYGSATLKVRIDEGQRDGELFAPFHWTAETASDGRVGALVQNATDAISGQPELKATPANMRAVEFSMQGFLLSRSKVDPARSLWWARTRVTGGHGYHLAGNALTSAWRDIAAELLDAGRTRPLAELIDGAQGWYRAAVIVEGRLEACLFLARDRAALPQWDWLKEQLATDGLSPEARRALLAGRSGQDTGHQGPNVCACFGVGQGAILSAVQAGCTTAENIGEALKAGTNCGSCLPEIRRLIQSAKAIA